MPYNWEVTLTLIDQNEGSEMDQMERFTSFSEKLMELTGQPVALSSTGNRWTVPLQFDVLKPWVACQRATELVMRQCGMDRLWLVGVVIFAEAEAEQRFEQMDKVREARELLIGADI